MVSGFAAALVCALFLAVVFIPPSRGQGPAPIAAPPIEPQPQSGAAPARTASTLTIVSAPQDGVLVRLCSDPLVTLPMPPNGDRQGASVAPVVGRAVNVPLATYIYDRTGERLLYTLDERRDIIATGAVPARAPNPTMMEGWRVFVLCPPALNLLPREDTSHIR
jgi:hypothetical protein